MILLRFFLGPEALVDGVVWVATIFRGWRYREGRKKESLLPDRGIAHFGINSGYESKCFAQIATLTMYLGHGQELKALVYFDSDNY